MGSRESDGDQGLPADSRNHSSHDKAEQQSAPRTEEGQSAAEALEERRKLRRLQMMMDMVMSVIGQDPKLTVEEAAELVADSRRAALAMFPDKELAYNLIYRPRLQRLMRERFRIQ